MALTRTVAGVDLAVPVRNCIASVTAAQPDGCALVASWPRQRTYGHGERTSDGSRYAALLGLSEPLAPRVDALEFGFCHGMAHLVRTICTCAALSQLSIVGGRWPRTLVQCSLDGATE